MRRNVPSFTETPIFTRFILPLNGLVTCNLMCTYTHLVENKTPLSALLLKYALKRLVNVQRLVEQQTYSYLVTLKSAAIIVLHKTSLKKQLSL